MNSGSGGRIQQICLCSGMGETEEPPPEMHVLKPRNSSGEREGVTFFHLSNKPCLVASLEVIVFVLDLFLWTPFLVWDCLYGAVDETLIHVFSSTQERGQGEKGWMSPVRPWSCCPVRCWEAFRRCSWEKGGKSMVRKRFVLFLCHTQCSVSLLVLPCLADLTGHQFFGSHRQ